MIANVIVLKNALVVAKKTRIALARSVIAAVKIAKNAIVQNVIVQTVAIANVVVWKFSKFSKNQNATVVVNRILSAGIELPANFY